jgi:UDP-glucose 4-epimerase
MKKNILITGASGFIGSFLVEEAIKKGYQTFAGVRPSSSKKYLSNPEIQFVNLDFSNDSLLDDTLKNHAKKYGKFDYIIHTAGVTKSINKSDFDKVNYEQTKQFVQALQRNNVVPDKFVFISSLAAFGPAKNDIPIRSIHAQEPLTAYGSSKQKVEDFLLENLDFPSIIISPTAVYGPRDKDFIFLLKSIEQHVEMYIGNDKQILSFVHVEDLKDAIFIGMESSVMHQKLLVSDLQQYTSKEFNRLVKTELNTKTISLIVPVAIAQFVAVISEAVGHLRGKTPLLNRERLKEFKAKNWSVDCSEIVELGYIPKYNLEQGLQHTITWYKEHGLIKIK